MGLGFLLKTKLVWLIDPCPHICKHQDTSSHALGWKSGAQILIRYPGSSPNLDLLAGSCGAWWSWAKPCPPFWIFPGWPCQQIWEILSVLSWSPLEWLSGFLCCLSSGCPEKQHVRCVWCSDLQTGVGAISSCHLFFSRVCFYCAFHIHLVPSFPP